MTESYKNNQKKKKLIGLLFSFIVPGMGNLYARQVKTAIVCYLGLMIIYFSLKYLTFNLTTLIVVFASGIIWSIGTWISGYRSVRPEKVYDPVAYDKWYVYLGITAFYIVSVNFAFDVNYGSLSPMNMAHAPTSSMDPALQVGDRFTFNRDKNISRNDIMLFYYPPEPSTMYVKRCVAVPGDSLLIARGQVIVNGDTTDNFNQMKYQYLLTVSQQLNERFMQDKGISEFWRVNDTLFSAFISPDQIELIRKNQAIRSITATIKYKNEFEAMTFPQSTNFNWNADNFGPLLIPAKGLTIQMNEFNNDLYFNYIEEENEEVEKKSSGIYIDGIKIDRYTFKENYYFVMGDNRHNSLDSRYWGFVSKKLLIGKAGFIYWSRDMNRVGLPIH